MPTVTVKGQALELAPLKSLQVAQFMDDSKSSDNSTSAIIRRSLTVVAQSLANGGSPQGETIDQAITALDEGIPYTNLDPAFRDVMELTGIKLTVKGDAGEAAAAQTTSESSAAS